MSTETIAKRKYTEAKTTKFIGGPKGYGFRVNGERKRALLEKLNEIADTKAKQGVNVRTWINKIVKVDSKKVPNKFTTKQLSGLIAQIKEL